MTAGNTGTETPNQEQAALSKDIGRGGDRRPSRQARFHALSDEVQAARARLDRANGEYRNVLKRVKAEGFLSAEMARAIQETRKDKASRDASHKEYIQYVKWLEE